MQLIVQDGCVTTAHAREGPNASQPLPLNTHVNVRLAQYLQNVYQVCPFDMEITFQLQQISLRSIFLINVDRPPHMPQFLGNSFLSVRGFKDTSWTETLLEITFLPKEPTGLLIYSGFSFDKRGDFICVALLNGKVIVSMDLGHGPAFVKLGIHQFLRNLPLGLTET